MLQNEGMLTALLVIASGVAVGMFGRWQRNCALEELRGGRPTEWPLGARHQLVGAWMLLVFGAGLVWAGMIRFIGAS